jgi:hypothetical protein
VDAAAKNGMDVDVDEPVLPLPSLPDESEREDTKTADEDDNDFGTIQEEDGTAVGSVNEVATTMLLTTPVPQRISIKMRARTIIMVEARCIDQDANDDAVKGFILLFLSTSSYHHRHR